MLNILVLHGYVQPASTVRSNTRALAAALAENDFAALHYVDGPAMRDPNSGWGASRPWWVLQRGDGWLDPDMDTESGGGRWEDVVRWWGAHLAENTYDGVVGLSQGAAMAALLLSMLRNPSAVPGFSPGKTQPIRFAILCSGFISRLPPHSKIYDVPVDMPTLHTVDDNDAVVSAQRTVDLAEMFGPKAQLMRHDEGHSIPVRGAWPKVFREFVGSAVQDNVGQPALPAPACGRGGA